jgi:pimeloyl-ACP methyl ester carboxylesterase
VSLLAWSLGGPRAGGYAAQHPEKVQKLVLRPAYNRAAPGRGAGEEPAGGHGDEHAVARGFRD